MWIDFSKGAPDLFELKDRFDEKWQQIIFSFLEQWYDKKPFILTSTSGTTGKRKEISLKKEYMRNSARMSGDFFKLAKGSTALLCLSPEYIAAKMMLVRSAVLGLRLYCVDPSSEPLRNLDLSFDFAAMVPLQLFNIFSDIHRIKKLLVGGAPLTLAMEELLQKIHTACYASYGMTETLSHIALRRINGSDKSLWYTSLPGIEIGVDHRKCLKIFSPLLMDDPLQTNDLVRLQAPDRFKWMGRYDYLINSGGIKIIPEEWEAKLQGFISRRFFLSSLADEALGEKLIMIVQGNSFDIKFPDELFKEACQFYKPKEIYFVSKFLETPTGKIRREETLSQIHPLPS
ncbi:AMP-binding protein [Bacteroidetes bacterium endosymbiont of Geopemphigus sp.]|uniref:AMP-binding protein n=1 Tax=Bacteroidetes bacterium endosymbiont of Geopemphigus sp. TaxID=2047937 RepID=UPI000CD27A53|nr:AMP-binding protein [Bacteroidetes bacterium endosymbiont of Geopemphigus sp.]